MATIEQIYNKYSDRIVKYLNEVREILTEEGWHVDEPYELGGDSYEYWLYVSKTAETTEMNEDDIDIRFEVLESEECDGTENGVAFGVAINTVGGAIVGGCTPFNYSDDLWIPRDDSEGIEARFRLMEGLDASELAYLLEDYR